MRCPLSFARVGSPKATNSRNALIVSSISSKDGFSPGPYGLGLFFARAGLPVPPALPYG